MDVTEVRKVGQDLVMGSFIFNKTGKVRFLLDSTLHKNQKLFFLAFC